MKQYPHRIIVSAAVTLLLLSACAPEIGSDEWCAALNDKDKNEWTIGETKDYAKHCIFK